MRVDCRILIDAYVKRTKCKITKIAKLRVSGCVFGWTFCQMLHAGRYTKSSSDSSQNSDGDVDDFLPDFLFVHSLVVFFVVRH